ncbi:MAG: hypothetical protein KGH72_01455 [Candidatus Micrarchaeota archaeon]|nr:hypothetical protein [Candidatus Micrarchaeota archaeon]
MNKLVLGAIALAAVIVLGAGFYFYQNPGNAAIPPTSRASLNSTSSISSNVNSSAIGSSANSSMIQSALADCAKAGISASQCQSYCQSNPSACGFSGQGSNGSSSQHTSNTSVPASQAPVYHKLYVGQSTMLMQQFNIRLVSVNATSGNAIALLNVSDNSGHSTLRAMGEQQYTGFGQGSGPYLLVYQIHDNSGSPSQGWATINMSYYVASGFSSAASAQEGNQSNQQGNQHGYGNQTGNSTGNQTSEGSIASLLMACQNQTYLTALPTNLSSMAYITPLGSLNPAGGHPIPSDHEGVGLVNSQSIAATVYAPGNVHILQIVTQNSTINGEKFTDSAIYFAPCRQLVFYYGHVATLSSALQKQVVNASKNAFCQTSQQSAGTSKTCTYTFDYMAKAGEVLGAAGGPNTNILGFDFGGYDLRTPTPAFIDPTRQYNDFGRPINAICFVNYYNASMQSVLYPKMNDTQKGPNGYPWCGTDMQDLAGTIQGNWYLNGSSASGQAVWSDQLSIAHWFENPSIGTISFGGTVAQASMSAFTPMNSGYVNREPSQVTADGHAYCYYPDNTNTSYGISPLSGGHFVVQLINSNTLKIEYQSGSCPANPSFTSPVTYIR